MATLDGFRSLGVDTWLAVGARHTDHPQVVALHASPHVDYRPDGSRRRRTALWTGRRVERLLGLEEFAQPYTRHLLDVAGTRPDVLVCFNLHGGSFALRYLRHLSREVPVVLHLSDSWLFTGHCAVPGTCSRWEHGCGACPDLDTPPSVSRDATAFNWLRKQRILSGCRVDVVAPSHWLLERARRSTLAGAIDRAAVIPNGIDLRVFAPGSRARARQATGVDPRARVLLHVANDGAANPYKDTATLRSAAARLAGAGQVELLIVGRGAPPERLGDGIVARHLGRRDAPELADLYRAADLYVHAASEESFALTAAEALACGTPVVAAATGGITEVVDDRVSGLIVAPGSAGRLAAAFRCLLDDAPRRERMGAAGAVNAAARFDQERTLTVLHEWCVRAVARRPTARLPAL